MNKKQKGITLIALVITIIVLLILAGVSIAMLTGNNGILTQAQNAKNKTAEAAKNEQLDLARQEDLINETLNGVGVEQVTDNNPGVLEENGTEYTINSIEDLVVFAHNVTNENNYEGMTVKLGTSLDFNSTKSYVDPFRTDYGKYGYNGELKTLLTSGEGFIPIGAGSDEVGQNSFSGTFDGQGNRILNLYINEKDETDAKLGFFSVNYGDIENLNLVNVNITRYEEASSLTGGLVGQNRADSTIRNCGISGNIKVAGNGSVTGLVGHNIGVIEDCYNLSNVKVETQETVDGIGIAGITSSSIGQIIRCFNMGDLEIISEGNNLQKNISVGGIVNYTENTIEECYNLGNITCNISESQGQDLVLQIGGVAGNTTKDIINCYNNGNIEVNANERNVYAGGITGTSTVSTPNVIKNSYNVGNINVNSQRNLYVGGIRGYLNSNTSVTNSYYLNQDNFTNTGTNAGTIKTEDEMKQASFSELLNSGNDDVVWKYDENKNNGYPILNWQK